jgi:hypothetical protein
MKLANTTTTPVALHLDAGVVVLGALDVIECTEDDAALGQVAALCRRGVLVVHPQPPQPDAAVQPPQSSPNRRRRNPARRTT